MSYLHSSQVNPFPFLKNAGNKHQEGKLQANALDCVYHATHQFAAHKYIYCIKRLQTYICTA